MKMDENGDKAINHPFFQPFHTPVEPGNVQQPLSGAQTVCELATAWVKCLALAHLLDTGSSDHQTTTALGQMWS